MKASVKIVSVVCCLVVILCQNAAAAAQVEGLNSTPSCAGAANTAFYELWYILSTYESWSQLEESLLRLGIETYQALEICIGDQHSQEGSACLQDAAEFVENMSNVVRERETLEHPSHDSREAALMKLSSALANNCDSSLTGNSLHVVPFALKFIQDIHG